MSYSVQLNGSDVYFTLAQIPDLQRVFKAVQIDIAALGRHYAYAAHPQWGRLDPEYQNSEAKSVESFIHLFENFGYEVKLQNGQLAVVDFIRDVYGDEERLWQHLAPLVAEGSALYWWGSDDDQEFRFRFADGRMYKEKATTVYELKPGDEISLTQIVSEIHAHNPELYYRKLLGLTTAETPTIEKLRAQFQVKSLPYEQWPRGQDPVVDQVILRQSLALHKAFKYFATRLRRQRRRG